MGGADGDVLREIAQRIATEQLEYAEFCHVYEDEEVAELELSREEMVQVFNLILRSRAVLPSALA